MTPTAQARQEQILNALNMTGARLRSMFATILQASQHAAQGVQVEADLRIVCVDISQVHDWLQSQLAEALSDTPLASAEGNAEIIAMGIPEPVDVRQLPH
ncbi:hypothetical protein [Paraburkholderia tropica]|uniref:hypothetical protein n=1 Tax=Paraburkholderia tropica TaxID=92647 RepID=UPI0015908625|nr:hypothetical protein [Paraburkholderia tropica]